MKEEDHNKMPTMYEIYNNHAIEYDDLVTREDYNGNLKKTLNKMCNFTNKSVIEFGSGTGRLTKTYIEKVKHTICYDRSPHMIQKAKKNLYEYLPRISFRQMNHLLANEITEKADIVLEGWAFGHTVNDDAENYKKTIHTLVSNCERLVKPGGQVIIIEKLGTGLDEPNPPSELLSNFYKSLENDYGYSKKVISMDYKFETINDAKIIMGFFFGEWIIPEIEERNSRIIPEYTGIWTKTIL
jgi:ubiquinone/menaquinone biosynthesis C-methylase UbiE